MESTGRGPLQWGPAALWKYKWLRQYCHTAHYTPRLAWGPAHLHIHT